MFASFFLGFWLTTHTQSTKNTKKSKTNDESTVETFNKLTPVSRRCYRYLLETFGVAEHVVFIIFIDF